MPTNLAIDDDLNWVGDFGHLESIFDQEDIVLLIFNQKNRLVLALHRAPELRQTVLSAAAHPGWAGSAISCDTR